MSSSSGNVPAADAITGKDVPAADSPTGKGCGPVGRQRSEMSVEEQLRCPEGKLKDDPVTEAVVLFAWGIADALVSAARMGASSLLSVVREVLADATEDEVDTFAKLVAEKQATPKPPTEEEIQQIREWARQANNRIADMNNAAKAANDAFIETGNAEFSEGAQGFRRWVPDEELMKARLEKLLENASPAK